MAENWESCVRHLKSIGLLPSDCDATNIIGHIKDGAILCRLLNYLKPLSIDSKNISLNPRNSKFLSSKNLQVFLNACQSSFALEEESMFQVNDLLNEENTDNVLKTLSRLLSSELAQRRVGHTKDPMPLPETVESNYESFCEDEEIYQRAIDSFPQTLRSSMEKISPKQRCIDELISTEKKFIKILELLLKKYKVALVNVLHPYETNFIFSLIEKMHGIHTEFHKAMMETLADDSRTSIAECFISNKEKFLVYGEYCSNVTSIQALIDCITNRSDCKKAIEKCQRSTDDGVKLRDLFIVPMQRILKYPLFVKNCLDNTDDKNQIERKMLSMAMEEIEDLAQYVNEVKRDYENISNIDRIESSIKGIESNLPRGAHLKNYGRLLKDGEVKCKTLNKLQVCVLFLFDKVLLLGIREKEKDAPELKKYFVISSFITRAKSDKYFALLNDQSVTEFKAKSKEERDDWVRKLEIAKENISPTIPWNRDTPPPKLELCTFNVITICDVCRKLLKGVFFQGYHCPNPVINVHRECIPRLQYKIPDIPGVQPTGLDGEPWYAGDIDRDAADLLLQGCPDGTYLVRTKESGYVITLMCNGVTHIRVEDKNGRLTIGDAKSYYRIQDIIHFYREHSLENVYKSLTTKLVYPYRMKVTQNGSPGPFMGKRSPLL